MAEITSISAAPGVTPQFAPAADAARAQRPTDPQKDFFRAERVERVRNTPEDRITLSPQARAALEGSGSIPEATPRQLREHPISFAARSEAFAQQSATQGSPPLKAPEQEAAGLRGNPEFRKFREKYQENFQSREKFFNAKIEEQAALRPLKTAEPVKPFTPEERLVAGSEILDGNAVPQTDTIPQAKIQAKSRENFIPLNTQPATGEGNALPLPVPQHRQEPLIAGTVRGQRVEAGITLPAQPDEVGVIPPATQLGRAASTPVAGVKQPDAAREAQSLSKAEANPLPQKRDFTLPGVSNQAAFQVTQETGLPEGTPTSQYQEREAERAQAQASLPGRDTRADQAGERRRGGDPDPREKVLEAFQSGQVALMNIYAASLSIPKPAASRFSITA